MNGFTPDETFKKYNDKFTLIESSQDHWCIYEREFVPCRGHPPTKTAYQLIVFKYIFGKFKDPKTGETVIKPCIPWSMWGNKGWTYGPYTRGPGKEVKAKQRVRLKFEEMTGTPV